MFPHHITPVPGTETIKCSRHSLVPCSFLLLVCEKEPGYEAGIDVYVYPVLIKQADNYRFSVECQVAAEAIGCEV